MNRLWSSNTPGVPGCLNGNRVDSLDGCRGVSERWMARLFLWFFDKIPGQRRATLWLENKEAGAGTWLFMGGIYFGILDLGLGERGWMDGRGGISGIGFLGVVEG